jgi:hypothetical protein
MSSRVKISSWNGKSPERMVADNIIITMDVIIVFSEYRQALV